MEHAPTPNDDSHEVADKKDSKKSKKSTKADYLVGSFAIKPSVKIENKLPAQASSTVKKPSAKEHGDLQDVAERRSESNAVEIDSSTQNSESAPQTELTAEEQRFVEQELVREAIAESPHSPDETSPDTSEVHVNEFRLRIVAGEDSDIVLEDIVHSLRAEGTTIPESPEAAIADGDDVAEEQAGDAALPPHEGHSSDEDASTPPEDRSTAGGASGGGTTPPPPPSIPSPGELPEPPRRGNNGNMPSPGIIAPAAAVRAPVAESLPSNPVYVYERTDSATTTFVSGLIGYMLGRRRGRIRTEKKLQPVQKKLQKEVAHFQQQLQVKEGIIRAAAHNYNARPQATVVPPAKETRQSPRTAGSKQESRTSRTIEQTKRLINDSERVHIGHIVVTAESRDSTTATQERATRTRPASPHVEKSPASDAVNAPKTEKDFIQLSRNDLLRLSEKIIVDGTSLREIYKNRLVGEKGLRRLVAVHMRGGDIKRQLRREIVEREIDFERDPVMRDQATVGGASRSGGTNNNLESMLQRAAATFPSDNETSNFYQAQATQTSENKQQQRKRQHVYDVGFSSIIVTLTVLIFILLATR